MAYKRMLRVSLVSASVVVLAGAFVGSSSADDEQPFEFNTAMLQWTIRIQGPWKDDPSQLSLGTGFVLARPYPTDPKRGRAVLVTAAHVFNDIAGDTATIIGRTRKGDKWEPLQAQLNIRAGGEELFVRHPTADVAAIYIRALQMSEYSALPTTFLATDDVLERFEVHPGDRVFAVGYPRGFETKVGAFPILRTGVIASYPLLPTKKMKTFWLDTEVWEGNSGGPVYLWDPDRLHDPGVIRAPVEARIIMGLISAQRVQRGARIALAQVVHASLVRETIEMLEEPD